MMLTGLEWVPWGSCKSVYKHKHKSKTAHKRKAEKKARKIMRRTK